MTNFDTIHDRRGTGSEKWDRCDDIFKGENLLPMWVADMDFQVPEKVKEALHRRIDHGIFGYSAYTDSVYESVINWFSKRHKWSIERDWIVFSPGVVPGINFLLQALTSPGDAVMIQRPVYYPFMKLIEAHERKLVNSPLVQESTGKYVMNFDDMEKKIAEQHVRAFILCSPHNPVGRVWQEDELRRMTDICMKHEVLIISDEIHCDLIFQGHRHIPLQAIAPDYSANIITCTAPSKTFNLAGLQTSNIIVPDKTKREKFKNMLLKNGMIDPNSLGPVAMEAAYTHGAEWLDSLIDYVDNNIKSMENFLQQRIPEVTLTEPEGTYLTWLDFRKLGMGHKELTSLLIEKAGVAPDPGHIFGEEGKGFQRLNMACPSGILSQGLEQIASALGR